MTSTAHDYAAANAVRFYNELIDLLRIPSVSTQPEHAADVQQAAEWLVNNLRVSGFETAEAIYAPGKHPIVYAEWLNAGEHAPTVLVYGHYDVQPAAKSDGWDTEPFEPVEREGKIYARGAIDSKSNVIAQIKAAETLIATHCPVNLKLIFEGEEESSGNHLPEYVAAHRDRLRCDVCVVCDGSMSSREQPFMPYALRGIMAMDITITGPVSDLHSGHYGGTVHNPIQALSEILAQLHNPDGSVNVPGFYDDVLPIPQQDHEELAGALPWLEAEWQEVVGAPQQWGEPGFNLHERIGARPTLEINGIAGGYAGTGFKTVIPAKAWAKVSCRLVANQDFRRIYELVSAQMQHLAPSGVRVETKLLDSGNPLAPLPLDSAPMLAARAAYMRAWNRAPLFTREGGSVPIAVDFQRELGAPIVLLAFGYKGCRAHGQNEHVYLNMFHKGIDTMIYFCEELADQWKAAL